MDVVHTPVVCFVSDGKNNSTCCERLSIGDERWKLVAKMNEARKLFQVVSCGKFMCAIGGCGLNGTLICLVFYGDNYDTLALSTLMVKKRA